MEHLWRLRWYRLAIRPQLNCLIGCGLDTTDSFSISKTSGKNGVAEFDILLQAYHSQEYPNFSRDFPRIFGRCSRSTKCEEMKPMTDLTKKEQRVQPPVLGLPVSHQLCRPSFWVHPINIPIWYICISILRVCLLSMARISVISLLPFFEWAKSLGIDKVKAKDI